MVDDDVDRYCPDRDLISRLDEAGRLTNLLLPYPAEEIKAYSVSPPVNKPDHDAPCCIVPAA